jgi:hypothetical protein
MTLADFGRMVGLKELRVQPKLLAIDVDSAMLQVRSSQYAEQLEHRMNGVRNNSSCSLAGHN